MKRTDYRKSSPRALFKKGAESPLDLPRILALRLKADFYTITNDEGWEKYRPKLPLNYQVVLKVVFIKSSRRTGAYLCLIHALSYLQVFQVSRGIQGDEALEQKEEMFWWKKEGEKERRRPARGRRE